MGAQGSLSGQLRAWANNTQFISGGITPTDITFDITAPTLEFLPLTSSGQYSRLAGLGSWTFTLTGQLATPRIGSLALVTFANGHVVGADKFDLTIDIESFPATPFNASEVKWHAFIPGAFRWNGSYGGFLDSSTALSAVGAAATAGAATFQYTADHNLAGPILTDALGARLVPGTPNEYTYGFAGTSTITQSTTSSGIIPSGVFVIPSIGVLSADLGDGTEIAGSAFPTSIRLQTGVGDFVSVVITGQGTGDPNLS